MTKEKYYISGNTYEFRQELKNRGCRYDPNARQWYHANKAEAEKAQALIDDIEKEE